VKRYVRQTNWRNGVVLPAQPESGEMLSVRALEPAEVLAMRGDFFVRRNRLDAAKTLLEEAVALGPSVAMTHEALGFYDFRSSNFAEADAQTSKAIELGSTSFMTYYYRGMLLLREFSETDESTKNAQTALETSARLNPLYAPTFEALTQAYSRSAETKRKALDAAETAARLDPDSRSYKTNLAYVLLNNGRAVDAEVVAERLWATAGSAEEKKTARSILNAIEEEEQWEKESAEIAAIGERAGDQPSAADSNAGGADSNTTAPRPATSRRQLGPPEWMAVEGVIGSVDCAKSPEVTLMLNLRKGPMDFHVSDFARIGVSGVSAASVPGIESCKAWSGRRVKVWFRLAKDKDYLGEIIRIYFY
jgi:tetratricopeptide (TPR) repeat protein